MARKEKFDYFQAFIKSSEFAVDYAHKLVSYFEKNLALKESGKEADEEYSIDRYHKFHELETQADTIKHDVITALAVEFIAPIEREDIIEISDELDNICDCLDDVLQRMYMYDVRFINEDVLELARVVARATDAVNAACKEFPNFKKSKDLRQLVIQIGDCEEEGDRIYIQAMHNNYAKLREADPGTFDATRAESIGVGALLSELEKCCDACESVGDAMLTVALKNS